MEKEIEYLLIHENILESANITKSHALTDVEVAKLVVNKDIIQKFIQLYGISIQFDIWNNKYWDKTLLMLEVVKSLWEISEQIWNIDKVFKKAQEQDKK